MTVRTRIAVLSGLLVLFAGAFGAAPGISWAATGTLDTGALTPQATGSRTADEIMNTGAAARTQGGEKKPAPSLQSASPQAGMGVPGPAGNTRPPQ